MGTGIRRVTTVPMKPFVVSLLLSAMNSAAWPQEPNFHPQATGRALKSRPDMAITATRALGLAIGDCSDYIDLSGRPLPIVELGTTSGATNDYGPFPSRPDSWLYYWDSASCAAGDKTYKWTVPHTGRYTISLGGSSYDAGLLVYRFTCPVEPTYPEDFICGADDAYEFPQPELYCQAFTVGEELLIIVDGWGNRLGDYTLRIAEYQPASNIDAFVYDTMQTYHIPGVSACAIRNGNIVWTGNYGYADIAQGRAPNGSTPFLIASISKTLVSVSLMQLWEDGLFGLDDDINRYLPWQVRNPSYPDSAITFRMLMTHMSTILDNWDFLLDLITWGGDSPIPLDEFLMNYLVPGGRYYSGANFAYAVPGHQYNYCNVGAALAGFLVERINPGGLSLEEYCQNSVFGPLGMSATSWFLENMNIGEVAVPYRWNGSTYIAYQHSGSPYYPAAQVRTSSAQLARHLIAFQQHGRIGGQVVLDSTTVELMTIVQSVDPNWGEQCGLFWMTFPGQLGGKRLWGHSGGWFGYRTNMFYCPDENTAGIVLTNGMAGYGRDLILNEVLEWARRATTVVDLDTRIGGGPVGICENHPNPFRMGTDITYKVPASQHVTVGVYDVAGRLIRTLFEGAQLPGVHKVRWEAGDCPPGVYFVRLQMEEVSRSRKVLLVR